MSTLLAIDPGNTHSGWVLIDVPTRRPLEHGKTDNYMLRDFLLTLVLDADHTVIEMVASYGMPVGAEVFDTCVWIGRLIEAAPVDDVDLIKRQPVKLHHCHSPKAKDSNVRQALVDRFTPGQPNHGKGTRDDPGWFHGFHADIWQAYALAVYAADVLHPADPIEETV